MMLGEISELTEYKRQDSKYEPINTYKQDWEKGEIRVRKNVVLDRFTKFLRDRWQNRKLEDLPSLSRKLKQACPKLVTTNRLLAANPNMLNYDEKASNPPTCYSFPSLGECREGFEGMIKGKIDW